MPIEISCSNCQAILRVADEHAGKSARCPQCSTVIPIPLTPLQESQSAGSGRQDQPSGHNPASSANPYSAPSPTQGKMGVPIGVGANLAAHRGPTILVLGIVSLVCCFFAAIPAIIMANEDLRRMDNGTMNPEGRGLTTAGKVIGIVSLILNALAVILNIGLLFVSAVA